MLPARPRLTIVETISHQQPNGQPTSVDSRFGRYLQSGEEPYTRKVMVTQNWEPLDCGWLDEASIVSIVNNEGRFTQVQPTQEQRELVEARIVEIGCRPELSEDARPYATFGLVRPGESYRGEPAVSLKSLMIRCRSGQAKCTITIFPK